jgi:hypothetical protein
MAAPQSEHHRIALAVKEALNDGEFSQTIAAEVRYAPATGPSDAVDLRVMVVPVGGGFEDVARGMTAREYKVDIAVQKRLVETDTEAPAMMLLVEEIGRYFVRGRLDDVDARCTKVEFKMQYSAEMLREVRLFFAVVTLSFVVLP